MGGAALVLRMYSIRENNHLICPQTGHQGFILGYKRRLFGFIGLRRKQLWFLILELQTAHQLGGTRGAVALTIFRQNESADLIGIAGWVLGKMSLQNLFLFHGQVPLALAVVLQTEERQPCTSKGEPPFCQNAWADVQNPANRPGIFSSVQKKKRTRTFPNKGIYLAPLQALRAVRRSGKLLCVACSCSNGA